MTMTFGTAHASDGTRIWYAEQRGEGTPLLLVLHSFFPPASVLSHYSGSQVLHGGLAGGASWYMFDWRGTGRSAKEVPQLTFGDLVDDMEAVADAIGVPFDVCAVNDGCGVAVAFAARRPEKVRRLLLVQPQGQFARSPEFTERTRRMSRADPDSFFAQGLMWVHPGIDPAETWAIRKEALKAKPMDVVVEVRLAALSEDALQFAPAIIAPTFVLVAGEEAQDGLDLAAAIPGARAVNWTSIGDGTINGAAWRKAWDEAMPPHPSARTALSHGATNPTAARPSGLSIRELEVVALLAAGRTNAQIAAALVVSEHTASTHVRHILQKTGTANRAEASAWAVREGLG